MQVPLASHSSCMCSAQIYKSNCKSSHSFRSRILYRLKKHRFKHKNLKRQIGFISQCKCSPTVPQKEAAIKQKLHTHTHTSCPSTIHKAHFLFSYSLSLSRMSH